MDRGEYPDIFAFNKDMKLVWSNAKKFNLPGSNIFNAAGFLCRTWNRKFATIRKDPEVTKLWGRKSRRSKPKKSPRVRDRETCIRRKPEFSRNSSSGSELSYTSGIFKPERSHQMKKTSGLGLSPGHSRSKKPAPIQGPGKVKAKLKVRKATVYPVPSLLSGDSNIETKIDKEKLRLSKKNVKSSGDKWKKINSELRPNSQRLKGESLVKKQRQKKSLSRFLDSRGVFNIEQVKELSMSQLNALGNELNLDTSQTICKADRQKEIIFRLEWIGKQSMVKAHATSSWSHHPVILDGKICQNMFLSIGL